MNVFKLNTKKHWLKGSIFISFLCFFSTLTFAQQDTLAFPFNNQTGGLYLNTPAQYEASFDPATGNYVLRKRIGSAMIGEPIILSQEEYFDLLLSQSIDSYYLQKSRALDNQFRGIRYAKDGVEAKDEGFVLPSLKVKNKLFETIFGGSTIELIPKGYASLDLGIFYQKLDNPQILPQNRQSFAIDLQQRIQMSILGKVGENLQLEANYDTQAGFGFENRMNLGWRPNGKGGEDNIIQNIEFGNVSMPLSTSLITGAQSLFGAKGEFKFGNTNITTVFSQQNSEARNITVEGGGVVNNFKIYAKDYERNQHYFLSQFFRNSYDTALENYPFISSQINISRLEIWVIDKGNTNQQNRRAIVGVRDLGNDAGLPQNGNLYTTLAGLNGIREPNTADNTINNAGLVDANGNSFANGEHYLVHENARLLRTSEYKFYPNLGYISLNQPLNDNELLAVSFQYTNTTNPTEAYTVGEFSDQQSELLIAKLIKSNSNVDVNSPMWDLMMKNIYSLQTLQLSPENFMLNVFYQDPNIGSGAVNYLPNTPVEDKTLLQVLNVDRLNVNGQLQQSGELYGDGLFDYLPGVTVDPNNGRIIFTTIEPFAKTIADAIGTTDSEYVLNDLYDELPITFEQDNAANRYFLEGRYQGAGGDGIPLGAFNVPQGSVKVTANGQELLEGVDYIVDYQLGRVNIINQALKDSGVPINISLENQSTFSLQKKRFIGLNVEHKFSDELLMGATYLNYTERPLTQKAQYNAEPVNNSVVGANLLYNTESEWLTRITDKIPLVDTSVPSQISFKAEAAKLFPGVNDASDNQSYIDDFEDSQSKINLMDVNSWRLASTPISSSTTPNPYFDSSIFNQEDYSFNYYRRMLSWYNIDPRFYGIGGDSKLSNNALSNHATRRVNLRELFSNRDINAGTPTFLTTFDLTYYPNERGPYNLNANWESESNDYKWAGITRPLNVTNLIQTNVEYIEFWMMDPYADGQSNASDGQLLLHIGNVSEDILRDGNMLYENGINQEGNNPDETIWGKQPSDYPILYSFQTEGEERRLQDTGYNGLLNEEELTFDEYSNFSNSINPITNEVDPAADDYVFYLDDRWDSSPLSDYVPERYKYFRNTEANSPSGTLSAASATPDAEDVNRDYNLDRIENYNQYSIALSQQNLDISNPFIVDTKAVDVTFANGQSDNVKWYLFRIPVDEYDQDAGAASDGILTAARYMRMIVRGFEETTTLRFGTFDMVRSDWRRYASNIYPNDIAPEGEQEVDVDNFSIGVVNIEENGTGTPPYVVPPGIDREEIQTSAGLQRQNEASMVLNIDNLEAEDARGVYKNTNLDLRRYKRLRMYSHLHSVGGLATNTEDLRLFLRVGSDLTNNYYEYEIPLSETPIGATSPNAIWPAENQLDVNTDWFVEAKKAAYEANDLNRYTYPVDDEGNKFIYVKGRPSLGNISTIMIGVRNVGSSDISDAVVWLNELRISEINNQGGYAATANMAVNLGDFAQINAAGSISTVGFGALDRGPVERQQEDVMNYVINTTVNLDKFTPKKWGLKIPFSYSIAERFIDPKFNPLDNDIEFDEDPNRDALTDVVRTYSKQVTYSFNNIRKERVNQTKPTRFYNVENFGLSFLYTSDYYRDIYVQYNKRKDLRASLNYNYNFKPKYIEPFKDWHMVNDTAQSAKYLQWVKEFNVNPIPSRLSVRTDILRTYNQQQYRDINSYLIGNSNPVLFNPIFSNNFLFSWQYNIGFDLTRSLRIDFTSATRTLSDITAQRADDQMIWRNLLSIGSPVNYNQDLQVNWKTPIRLLPYFEWADVELGYSAQYDWKARFASNASLGAEVEDIGNLAQNAQVWRATGNFNFSDLYQQFKPFQRVDSLQSARLREQDSINRSFKTLAEAKNGMRRIRRAKIKYKTKFGLRDYLFMGIQSFTRGQFNYNRTSGIILPGMLAEPNFIGQGASLPGPNSAFMFGSQHDIRRTAVENGWITRSPYLTEAYTSSRNTDFNANLQFEPSIAFRIDFNARRNFTRNFIQSGFNVIADNASNDPVFGYETAFENVMENFTISTISASAAWSDPDELYDELIANAQIVSNDLGNILGLYDADDNGFVQGYNLTNADVLVPAFLATYQGKSVSRKDRGYKKNIPLPNWNITYTGLKNIPIFTKYFDNLQLSHNYNSTYTVSGVQSSLNKFANPLTINNGVVQTDANGNPITGLDGNNNIYSDRSYGAISVVEAFSPLIGVDMTLRNNMQLRAQYNRDRIVSLSMTNYTLTEDYGNELVIGFGYIFQDFKFNMRYMGKKKTFSGDLNLRADFSLRDSETRIRQILENDSQITGGQNIFSLRLNAQYMVSKNLNLSLFYDQMMTKYKVSTAFPLSTIRAGINATFTFGN